MNDDRIAAVGTSRHVTSTKTYVLSYPDPDNFPPPTRDKMLATDEMK